MFQKNRTIPKKVPGGGISLKIRRGTDCSWHETGGGRDTAVVEKEMD